MQKIRWFVFILGTLAMIVVMRTTSASLQTQATPKGILDLELPFTKEKATAALAAWQTSYDEKGVSNTRVAIINTRWDFAFLFFYSGLLLLLTGLVARRHSGRLKRLGLFFQKAVWAVALLDVGENIGMFRMLGGTVTSPVVLFTSVCAALKWVLVLLVIIYILYAGVILLFRKKK
jgi:hypothetical protein